MPSFLANLKRRSKSNFNKSTDKLPETSNGASNGNGTARRRKSNSTLNSNFTNGSPPSTLADNGSSPNLRTNGATPPLPGTARPVRPSANSNNTKRYSMNGLSATINGSQKSLNPSSFLTPRVQNVMDGSWVNQKVLLIFGRIGDGSHKPLDGQLTVNHTLNKFPATQWPVYQSFFKALVYLQPGPNTLRLDFSSPKVSSSNTSIPQHSSWFNVQYLPLNSAPPLHLAIILGRDSEGTYDATPDRMNSEGNSLDLAIKKFRMSAYLWQAFTGEQMQRHGFERRCFRFEEEWQPGSLTCQDSEKGEMRNEAKIHIIRSSKTVQEIRDLELAQQYEKATKKGDLFGIAAEAVRDYFKPQPGHKLYVSCLFLDSHWDTTEQTIRGHAALGGGDGELQLAIFGSQALQSYPSSIEEVPQVFQDCTRTDTAFVANDCNESGSTWEAANIGIGAHLHETGHLFGCPHQESGIMLRDYVRLNRTFVARESYSTRTKSPGGLVLPEDECSWHELDALRFRFHPCFRAPMDQPIPGDGSVTVWTVDNGGVVATAQSGIPWAELYIEGDDVCHTWRRWPELRKENGLSYYSSHADLIESELRDLLPKDKRNSRFRLEIFSAGGGKHVVEDFSKLANPKNSRVKIPDGRWGYYGSKLGYSQQEGTEKTEVILENVYIQTKLLLTVRVWSGLALDGVEFIYEDTTSQLFGKRSGHSSDFPLDTRRGELVIGFALRAGLWIDGLQILTSTGRKSEWYGNPTGGSGHTLIPPRGYKLAGISGTCGQWVDGFSVIITR